MVFTDARQGAHRAGSVFAALDPSDGWVHHNAVVTMVADWVTFDAAKGMIFWQDRDGEHRHLNLPSGITTEAVAAIMRGLRGTL